MRRGRPPAASPALPGTPSRHCSSASASGVCRRFLCRHAGCQHKSKKWQAPTCEKMRTLWPSGSRRVSRRSSSAILPQSRTISSGEGKNTEPAGGWRGQGRRWVDGCAAPQRRAGATQVVQACSPLNMASRPSSALSPAQGSPPTVKGARDEVRVVAVLAHLHQHVVEGGHAGAAPPARHLVHLLLRAASQARKGGTTSNQPGLCRSPRRQESARHTRVAPAASHVRPACSAAPSARPSAHVERLVQELLVELALLVGHAGVQDDLRRWWRGSAGEC